MPPTHDPHDIVERLVPNMVEIMNVRLDRFPVDCHVEQSNDAAMPCALSLNRGRQWVPRVKGCELSSSLVRKRP